MWFYCKYVVLYHSVSATSHQSLPLPENAFCTNIPATDWMGTLLITWILTAVNYWIRSWAFTMQNYCNNGFLLDGVHPLTYHCHGHCFSCYHCHSHPSS